MRLSDSAKVIVGVLTALVALVAVALILLWLTMAFGMTSSSSPRSLFSWMDAAFPLFISLACGVNLLIYGMTAFYVTHAVKNAAASDVLRIIGILLVVFIPYLGMPAYYVLYILIKNPPPWALKPDQKPIIQSASPAA